MEKNQIAVVLDDALKLRALYKKDVGKFIRTLGS